VGRVISARFSRDAEVRERFRREARAAAQLRHPNVASVFHFGETPAADCFYAMEFIDGETLEARVRRTGPISVSLALEIAEQVGRALSAAQTLGLVHRDLKPSNIMLVGNERNFPEALRILQTYPGEKLPSVAEGSASSQEHLPRAISEAIVRLYAGDYSGAYEFFDSIRPYYENLTRDQPDSTEAHKNLAWIYAPMGWKEPALAEANRTI
jgi:serine/threonine protein kinase